MDKPVDGASGSPKNPHLPGISSLDLTGIASDDLLTANVAKALNGVKPDASHTMRGAQSVALYKRISPSVVLVVTDEGLGSGSLISSQGEVLTNWHVIKGYSAVGVIFKPAQEGVKVTKADIRRARVIKVDEISDLTLLQVDTMPEGVAPIAIGNLSDVDVGADVHAIGHPEGESWSYTQGVVSQVRHDYDWKYADKSEHKGTVIQTQTPINPGNSGGPLLSDSGAIIGVNSFGSTDMQGVNFAVAVDEVQRFLASAGSRYAPTAAASPKASSHEANSSKCNSPIIYQGRNKANDADIITYDLFCDGKTTFERKYPDDTSLPYMAVVDRNEDGTEDMIVFDFSRKGQWQVSLNDTNFNGAWDMVGHHPDGKIVPSWYETYPHYLAGGGTPLK